MNKVVQISSRTEVPSVLVPYNIEAEQALLGYLLLGNTTTALPSITFLKASHFWETLHQEMFEYILLMALEGSEMNPALLKTRFENHQLLLPLGGVTYFARIASLAGTVMRPNDYAKQILECYRRRVLLEISHEVQSEISGAELTSEEIIHKALRRIEVVSSERPNSFIGTSTQENAKIIQGFIDEKEPDKTGIVEIDIAMGGGLYENRTYCIAARPKKGKTTMLTTLSYNLNYDGVKHLFIACEMGTKEIQQRNIARALGRNALAFYENRRDQTFQENVKAYADNRHKDNTFFANAPGITFDQLKGLCVEAVSKRHCKGIILDYLQLVGGKEKNANEAEHQATVAQWLAKFTKENAIWILYAAQVNREGNIRGSDGIIMAADQVYILDKDDNDNAWMKCICSRYTRSEDVGTEEHPQLILDKHGPYFRSNQERTML